MFTGLIQTTGRITRLHPEGGLIRMEIAASFNDGPLAPGESIAVDGVCLTVTRFDSQGFAVDISPETLRVTSLGDRKIGGEANLERALRVGDRLGGHLVQGHVDGTGEVLSKHQNGETLFMDIRIPPELAAQCILKGGVAVDGVSLTINRLEGSIIGLALIPHTLRMVTLGRRAPGDRVNIETDMIGKYVAAQLAAAGVKSP
ncbi:MAG: Riboflavin synthase [Myxococcota bacterium]|nr:Riboflavin synthase [Myxococcota bacterium]